MSNKIVCAIGLALVACLAVGSARAEGKRKVAVLDVNAVGDFEAKTIAGLSTLIAFEASQYPVQVVSGADLRALISHDREKELLGCKDSSCLAEIGGALGADYILAPEVSEVGGVWLVSMSLLDVAHSSATKRVIRKTTRERELVKLTSSATKEIFDGLKLAEPAKAKASPEAKAVKTPEPVPEKALPEAAGTEGPRLRRRSKTMMISGIVSTGLGVLCLAGAAAAANQNKGKEAVGGWATLGVVGLGAGVPLWLIGRRKVPVKDEAQALSTPGDGALMLGATGLELQLVF